MTGKAIIGIDALGGLVKLGLREKEARVYLALLQLGEATAYEASRKSGVHPRSTYDELESLVGKGMVAFVEKGGARVFGACGLDSLEGWVDEKKQLAHKLTPLLEAQLKTHNAPLVRVFRGREGLRAVWQEVLKEGKPIFFYGGAMNSWRVYLPQWMPIWNKKREKLRLPVRILYVNQPGVKQTFNGYKYWQARPLPEKLYAAVAWWLYGEKMALVFWGEEPLVIVIQSAELAKSYKNFFEVMWRIPAKN